MDKTKLILLIFVVVVGVGLVFYMAEKNKQGKNLSAKKSEIVAKEGAKKEDNRNYVEPILEEDSEKKEISSKSNAQKSKKKHSTKSLAKIKERQAKEHEYELNKQFEAEAKKKLPLLSIQTNNPLDEKGFGPRRGEIWVRVKPDNARELKQVMKKLADLYRSRTGYKGPITIMHWVGGRPHFKMTFPANDENE